MTTDFQLAHACPHLTIEEEVSLGSDRRSLIPKQPIANANQIRVTANDTLIPQSGLSTFADLFGSVSGPFNIIPNENTLVVQNPFSTVTSVLPTGSRVPTDRVVEVVSTNINAVGAKITIENENGFLKVTDQSLRGPESRIEVSGLAAPLVGFVSQTRAKGRQVYPPWIFDSKPDLVTTAGLQVKSITSRFPKFISPVKTNPVFKMTYITYQNRCLRCSTIGRENDYRHNQAGAPLQIQNEDLLQQNVFKILTTRKRSNPFHPDYGTSLIDRIGIKAVGTSALTINQDVANALNYFQRIQEIQGRNQEITPRERLATIASVDVRPSETDPTVFKVDIVAFNASQQPVVISTVFAVPQAAALAGTNGLSLGLDGLGLDPNTRRILGV